MKPKSIGQTIAEYSVAMRQKYGCYPVPPTAQPEEGHENDVVEAPPDYTRMEDREIWQLSLNRKDERQRLVPMLPRQLRKATRSRQRRIEMLEWRNGEQDER